MKRALISVFYKEGIETVAGKLKEKGWEIVSTGGTTKYLRDHHIQTTEVTAITGFPEILEGRVKTLHPLIFGPILAKKNTEHLDQLHQFKTDKLDLVIVNFYPFEDALKEEEKGVDFMVENIDIGGPSMVRAAAKNFQNTVVIVDPRDYLPVVEELMDKGDISVEERRNLAAKAFAYTSFYDSLIAGFFSEDMQDMPAYFTMAGRQSLQLRYGENPHQRGCLYLRDPRSPLKHYEKLQGKELSFNNILDLSMAYETCGCFPGSDRFCVIVKHQNPCGAALADSQADAFQKAFGGDPRSAYGGIVGFNTPLEESTAEKMKKIFFEVIVAPDYTEGALELFGKKKNLRIIKIPGGYREQWDIKSIPGGFVLQDRDQQVRDYREFALKTSRKVTEREIRDIDFGWKLIKFVKSNAIIIVKDRMLLGVGAGQMSRVDSVDIAVRKSQFPLEGSVLLSDAFFPFPDSIEIAAGHKITAIVEPGGSVRDDEVIAAAEKNGLSLLFSGMRHFRH